MEFGAEAIYTWAVLHAKGMLVESPGPLVGELAQLVAVGRRPGLASSARVMARIVDEFPSLVDKDTVERLTAGLAILRVISALPDSRDAWLGPVLPEWGLDERNDRTSGAALAASLHKWYTQHEYALPAEVGEWAALSVDNVLPEVRREWERSMENLDQ